MRAKLTSFVFFIRFERLRHYCSFETLDEIELESREETRPDLIRYYLSRAGQKNVICIIRSYYTYSTGVVWSSGPAQSAIFVLRNLGTYCSSIIYDSRMRNNVDFLCTLL